MSPALDRPVAKLGAFAVVLGLVLGGGVAVGRAVGPIDVADHSEHPGDGHGGGNGGSGGGDGDIGSPGGEHPAAMHRPGATGPGGGDGGGRPAVPSGLLVAQAGYRLEPERTVLDGVAGAPFRFRIVGSGGGAVREFAARHGIELHLVIVSQDLTTFSHLHPTRAADGTWSAYLPALAPGAYRAFTDFVVAGGPELTLGVDLTVPGQGFFPPPLPPPATTARVDGYEVTMTGTPSAGSARPVELRVSRDGTPVAHLDPYLEGEGHLVAVRAGDLAYLRVQPLEDAGDAAGPAPRFAVDVPSPGDYRLFFQFAHGGAVHTAAFTVRVPAGGHSPAAPTGTLDAMGPPPATIHQSHDEPEGALGGVPGGESGGEERS